MNLDLMLTVTLVLAIGAFLGAPLMGPRLKEAYLRYRVRTNKAREQKLVQAALQRRQQQQLLENYDRMVPEASPSATNRSPEATGMASSEEPMAQGAQMVHHDAASQSTTTPQEALMSQMQEYQQVYNAMMTAQNTRSQAVVRTGHPRQKNALIALLLALFLGMFGVHNFYLKKIGIGITQLVLTITIVGSFLSAFWIMIECILILTGDLKDADGNKLTWGGSSKTNGMEGSARLLGIGIGVIAITVVLSGVLYVWASSLAETDTLSVSDFSVTSTYAGESLEYCTATFSLTAGQHRYCKVDVSQTQVFSIRLGVDEPWEDVRLYTMSQFDYASFSDDGSFNHISELSALDVNAADVSGTLDGGQTFYVVVYHPYDWEV